MKCWIVRHGETDWNVEGRCQGSSANPINKNGRMHAEVVARKLRNKNIQHFFCSDILRTRQTAEIIRAELRRPLEIVFDARLRYSFGDFEGRLKAEIPEYILAEFNVNPQKYHAETFEEMYHNMCAFVGMLKDRGCDNVLIISHGVIINILIFISKHNVWDEGLFTAERIGISHTDVLELEF